MRERMWLVRPLHEDAKEEARCHSVAPDKIDNYRRDIGRDSGL